MKAKKILRCFLEVFFSDKITSNYFIKLLYKKKKKKGRSIPPKSPQSVDNFLKFK